MGTVPNGGAPASDAADGHSATSISTSSAGSSVVLGGYPGLPPRLTLDEARADPVA